MGPPTQNRPASDAPSPHRPGASTGAGGDWVLDRLLGRGAFSEVWLAREVHGAHAPRALKVFTGPGAADWLGRRQHALWTIARKLSGQPHLVKLLAVAPAGQVPGQAAAVHVAGHEGPAPTRQPFVAMEYLAGASLEDWIAEPASGRPPLQTDEVMRDVVAAMAEAHRRGIHHGALKLSRVLLTRRPVEGPGNRPGEPAAGPGAVRAKVAGFGLADPGVSAMGADRMYEPPEAWAARAGWDPMGDDVFALGVIWYQLLTEKVERPPYDFADGLADAGCDGYTIRLLSRCLARPGRRFSSAAGLDEAFAEVGLPAGPPVQARYFDVSQIVREYLRARGKA